MFLSKLFLLLFLFSTSLLNASLVLTDKFKKYDNFTLQYLYDENASLTIENVLKINFTQTIPSQFTQGYKYGNAWFKIKILNNSNNEDYVLFFTESIWSTLSLYTQKDSLWVVQENGLSIPPEERSIKDNFPAFHLHIPKGEVKTLYLKANTIASQIGEFQVYTKNEFFRPNRITLTEWYTIYAFVLFAFILLNLYNSFVTKERIYLYYVGYVFIYIVFTFMHSGLYLSMGFTGWQEGLHVLGILTLFALLQFSIEFLDLKSNYPLMKKVFHYLSVVSIIFAFLLAQNIPYATISSNIFFSAVLILIVYVAIKLFKEGFNGAKYYLIALMLYLPSMAIMAMNFNTLLANTDITRYTFLGGAFLEVFVFTLILTNRYRTVNNEKMIAQHALIQEQNKNEEHLKSEIEKQTQHLQEANLSLTKQTKELQETKELLIIEARTDMLSGLYNRRYFYEASQKSFYTAMRYKQELSLLMIDIDLFKNINDTFGHIFGDKIIRIIANIIKKSVRVSDTVARYGGEEYIVLLPQSDKEDASKLAQRIRIEVEQENISTDISKNSNVTISVGVAQLDKENDIEIEQTIQRCDKALYQAKESGRNQVCVL